MLVAVRDARRIGQVERIDLGHQYPATRALLRGVNGERAPEVERLNLDAVERPQVHERRLVERVLVAFVVEA